MYAKERKERPFETRHIHLERARCAYAEIISALINEAVSDDLDPEGLLVEKASQRMSDLECRIESIAGVLATERRDFCQAERRKDKWASPSCGDGWLCPDSPTGVCTYENGHYDDCDHCGFPDERK
jgi:hypothetical protein